MACTHGRTHILGILMGLGVGLGLGGFAETALARQDTVPGSRYVSARGAALGDAFLPLPDDGAGALFYNPAAIARLRGFNLETFNLGLEMNHDFLSMSGLDFFRASDLSGYSETLAENHLKNPGIGGFYFPNFYVRGFAFGMLVQSKLASQKVGSKINYRALYQVIPTVGFGFNLAKGIMRFGYSAQWVNQTVARASVDDTEELGYTRNAREGAAISHNAGFALTFPFQYLPAINVVARNIGGAKYYGFSLLPLKDSDSSLGLPEDEEMSIDASLSMVVKLGGRSRINLVFQGRDLTNRSQTPLQVRAATSIELNIRDSFFLRGGYGSGYPSAGMGLKSTTAEFGLSWYSEELGQGFHEIRDVRYIMQYQARIF